MTVEFSVQTSEMSNFIHFFSNHASFLTFIENICSIEITPTPWLTRTCFAQISLARLFKRFTIPHVTRTQARRPWVCRVCHGTPRFWQNS